jgi:hypothetical protein
MSSRRLILLEKLEVKCTVMIETDPFCRLLVEE